MKISEVKENKTTELKDNKSSGENRFKVEEYKGNDTEKGKKGNWGIPVTVIFYLILLVYTAINLDNTDIATLLIPVVFYVIVNIFLRNSIQNDETKRLQDLNDIVLVAYVITYLVLAKELIKQADNISKFAFLLIGILFIMIVFFVFLPLLSKKRNKGNSHYK